MEHEAILDAISDPRRGSPLANAGSMLRRDVLVACGGYRDAFPVAEDLDLWFRMSRHGRLHILPEILLLIRKHEGNVTVTRGAVNLQSAMKARICHRVWQRTGAEVLENPELWQLVEKRLEEAWRRLKMFQALEARAELKQCVSELRRRPWVAAAKLLRRPQLVKGLSLYRKVERIIQRVTDETVDDVAAQAESHSRQPA